MADCVGKPYENRQEQAQRRRTVEERRSQGDLQGRDPVLDRKIPRRRKARRLEERLAEPAAERRRPLLEWQDEGRVEVVSREREADAVGRVERREEGRHLEAAPSERKTVRRRQVPE